MCTIFPHRRDGIYWVGVSGVTKKKKIREVSGTYNNWNFPEGLRVGMNIFCKSTIW